MRYSKENPQANFKAKSTQKDEQWRFESFVCLRPNKGGDKYKHNSLDIVKLKDGAVFFSSNSGEEFIYLYPRQVEFLIECLGQEEK